MLEAQAVNKRFGGLRAVADVSLNVQAGEIVALIGPNGAGKTTLFAMLAGFLRPDSGRVRFQNQDITGLKPHRICRLGMVRTFQVVKPFAGLSVRDNIAVAAHVRVAERKTTLALADTIAAQVGMKAALNKPASSLTVAGRKRLELARALATGPKLLLLDEVMAGLNATEIDDIVPVVRAIRDSGITVLLIEHVLRAVMSLSDRGYVLNQGAIIATGTPAEITRDPRVIEAYLGHDASRRLASAD